MNRKTETENRKPLVVAVDLGGTNFRLALVDSAGEILARHSFSTRSGQGRTALVRQISEAILALVEEQSAPLGAIQGVGLGIPGQLLPAEGRILFAPNLQELNNCPLGAELSQLLPWPVVLENDANAFALGEHWLGAGRGWPHLLGITLGTGVGGGLVLQGKIWQGNAVSVAEIGHTTIDPHGELCHCGNRGCLETLASANWTMAWVKNRLLDGEASNLRPRWKKAPDTLDARLLHRAAQEGDVLAQTAFGRVGKALGLAIANVVHLLGLPLVVIGGNFARTWDQFIEPLQRELDQRLTFFPRETLQIVPAVLGDNAGLLGAAKLALNGAIGLSNCQS